ncbi:MAG: T9SS type A sorting domain-containing protein [Bacteroidia bacterium]
MKFLKVMVCLFLLSFGATAQTITFTKYYDFQLEEFFNVLELSDGYLMTASSGSTISTLRTLIIKTDFNGDTVWIKQYGDTLQRYEISGLLKTSDGNYITGSRLRSYTLFKQCIYLLKFDNNGDTLWAKTIFAPGSDQYFGLFLTECSDKGFLIAGQQTDSLATDGNVFITKTDSLGNEEWTKNFGGANYDAALSSVQLTDQGFLTLGWTRSYGLGSRDLYLIKTDSIGNFKWQKTYGTAYLDGATGITKTADGNYLLSGYKGISSTQEIRSWLIKIDTSGTIIWQKTYLNSDSEIWWAHELQNNTIIAVGALEGNNGIVNAWVVKTDSFGNQLWDRSFGSYNDHCCFRDVIQTSDSGFACVGFAYKGPNGNEDGWLIKLDSLGCDSFGCATYTEVNEVNYNSEFSVYPNPVNDFLTIRFSYSLFSVCDITVYNMLGEQVYATRTFVQKQTAVPVSQLPPGMYFLSLKYEGQTVARKFVKR